MPNRKGYGKPNTNKPKPKPKPNSKKTGTKKMKGY